LPRVEEVFEKRAPRSPAIVNTINGVVSEIKETGRGKTMVILADLEDKKTKKKGEIEYEVSANRTILVNVGDKLSKVNF